MSSTLSQHGLPAGLQVQSTHRYLHLSPPSSTIRRFVDDSTRVGFLSGERRRLAEKRSRLVTSPQCVEAPRFWEPSFQTGTYPPQTLSHRPGLILATHWWRFCPQDYRHLKTSTSRLRSFSALMDSPGLSATAQSFQKRLGHGTWDMHAAQRWLRGTRAAFSSAVPNQTSQPAVTRQR